MGEIVPNRVGVAGLSYVSRIGSGGFADVFLCHQTSLNRQVAIKIVRPDTASDAETAAEAVFQEASLAAKFQHPSIMGVLEVGNNVEGFPYILMPYYRKGDLGSRLDKVPLPVRDVLHTGVQLAGAVATAHCNKVLHCDIKPQNVLFDDLDRPVLCDFGIASSFEDRFHTSVGFTLPWSAPEVLKGDKPTPASDVYGLAATLWAALLGHKPFLRSPNERIPNSEHYRRIIQGDITQLPANVPPILVSALVKALAPDPLDRTRSAQAFGKELQRVQQNLSLQVTPLEIPTKSGFVGASSGSACAPTLTENPPVAFPKNTGDGGTKDTLPRQGLAASISLWA